MNDGACSSLPPECRRPSSATQSTTTRFPMGKMTALTFALASRYQDVKAAFIESGAGYVYFEPSRQARPGKRCFSQMSLPRHIKIAWLALPSEGLIAVGSLAGGEGTPALSSNSNKHGHVEFALHTPYTAQGRVGRSAEAGNMSSWQGPLKRQRCRPAPGRRMRSLDNRRNSSRSLWFRGV